MQWKELVDISQIAVIRDFMLLLEMQLSNNWDGYT